MLVSVAVRLLYFVQLSDGPCLWLHRWAESDMHHFDQWGRGIAAGDWMGASLPLPMDDWHRRIAADFLQRHPAEQSALQTGVGEDPGRAVWQRWLAPAGYYQEPLYTYLVAVSFRFLSSDVRWVFAWQMVLGIATNVLVYLYARRYFGAAVGLLAGLMAALCGPVLMYELTLLRATSVSFAGMGLAFATAVLVERGTQRTAGLVGFATGVAVLLKAIFVLFLPVQLLLLVLGKHLPPRTRLVHGSALLGGLVLALLPLVVRNLSLGLPPFLLATAAPVNIIVGNAVDSGPASFGIGHVAQVMERSKGNLISTALATVRTHPSFSAYLGLLVKKFALLWNGREQPNNTNFYYFGRHSPLLRHLPVRFDVVAPLALLGIALAVHRRHRCTPLLTLVAVHLIALLSFVVFGRLRAPLTVALIPFAALGLWSGVQFFRTRRRVPAACWTFALALLFLWISRPPPVSQPRIRVVDYGAPYFAFYFPAYDVAASRNEWAAAARVLENSLAVRPPDIDALATTTLSIPPAARPLAEWYSRVYARYAAALHNAGDQRASQMQERAQRLAEAARRR